MTKFGPSKFLWGNMPAFDVLRLESNEGVKYGGDLSLLFAGMAQRGLSPRMHASYFPVPALTASLGSFGRTFGMWSRQSPSSRPRTEAPSAL